VEQDTFLTQNYDHYEVAEGKAAAKAEIQSRLDLKKRDVPMIGVVSRLVGQKGLHLIKRTCWRMLEKGGQFVLLGAPLVSPSELLTPRMPVNALSAMWVTGRGQVSKSSMSSPLHRLSEYPASSVSPGWSLTSRQHTWCHAGSSPDGNIQREFEELMASAGREYPNQVCLHLPFTLICLMRIRRLGFGTGRQRMALNEGRRPDFRSVHVTLGTGYNGLRGIGRAWRHTAA
jgi:hypothetical protein